MARSTKSGAAEETAAPIIYALRSKTGAPFRRDQALFAHDRWTLTTTPTEAQLAEPMLEALVVAPENADRLALYPGAEGLALAETVGEWQDGPAFGAGAEQMSDAGDSDA